MFKRTRLCTGLLLAFGSGAMLAPQVVLAQASTGEVARVEVTGSLIRRIEGEAALPVVIIKVEDLARAGVTNAEQAVQFITQSQGGTVTSGSVSGTNGAAAYADLRSLGSQRTLVLLNGKRVVSNPFATSAVDLNTLPLAAVERIETLPDGASSIYGTDAIAGVINFITRKDYRGGQISAQTQITEAGGGNVHSASVLGGIGDMGTQGWNITGALSVRKQEVMRGDERAFSLSSYQPDKGFNGTSPTTFPANYSQGPAPGSPTGTPSTVANANPTSPNCLPPSSISVPEANGSVIRCFADTQVFTNTVPLQNQHSLFLRGALALGQDHTASLEYFYSHNHVRTLIAPSPEGGLTLPQTSPFYPGNGLYPAAPGLDPTRPVAVAWRTTVLGSRSGEQKNDTQRLVGGLEGSFGAWDYQAALMTSNSEVTNTFLNGYPTTLPLRAGVAGCLTTGFTASTGACAPGSELIVNGQRIYLNPFGDQTPEGLAYMQANTVLGQVQDGEAKLHSATGSVSRSFGSLAGGAMTVALGAELRKEEMIYNTNVPLVSQAASSGLAGSGAVREGDRDVKAVMLEFNFPVLKGLDIGAAVRHDSYSDFGSTTNPKLSVRWQPTQMLLLRGSANTGFTAPTLTQLYAPNATTFTANRFNDPVLCPGGVPAAGAVPSRDCGIQFQRLTGGNPDLTAEKSKAWTLGFVLQPTPQLSFGIDYWNYYIEDSISSGIAETSVFADPVKYAALYIRCSQADPARVNLLAACQNTGAVDPLAYILNTNLNLGDFKTSGIDVQVNWASGPTAWGRFTASARGSYVTKYEFQNEPGGTWFNPLGNYNPQFGGPVIRYQQVTTIGWEHGNWSTLLGNRFVNGYRDQNSQGAPFNVAPFNTRKVGDYSVFDLSVSYTGIKGLTLGVGVLNLFDQDPPFTNQVGRFQARGYDDRFHNPLGRRYQLSAKYDF
jgi:iron complex outermembrane receptor protein